LNRAGRVAGAEKQHVERRRQGLLRGCFLARQQPHEIAAELGPAAAALAGEIGERRAQGLDIGAIVHVASVAFDLDQSSAGQNAEMRRHRVVRRVAGFGELARRKACGIGCEKAAQRRQPRGLRQRGEAFDRCGLFQHGHMSASPDIWKYTRRTTATSPFPGR
jgi:hypothetical protein